MSYQCRSVKRRSKPGRVERRRSALFEDHGRHVQFDQVPDEGAPGDLLQLESRQGIAFPKALDLPAVDVVVAEAAEEEVGEGIAPVSIRGSCGRPEPEGGMIHGKRNPEIENAQE